MAVVLPVLCDGWFTQVVLYKEQLEQLEQYKNILNIIRQI
jgi:hypothetical protein